MFRDDRSVDKIKSLIDQRSRELGPENHEDLVVHDTSVYTLSSYSIFTVTYI